MPYVEGESLRARLERGGALTASVAVRVLRDVADALAYAHKRGIVHRDIKPENVLLAEQHALVTDFGVAKALGSSAAAGTLTSAGIALGTPMYMAPEQAAGDPNTDHRCDIWATGALGYELLSGRTPFGGDSPHRVIAALLTEVPRPVEELRPEVPPALAAVVMRCLQKEASARYQTADALLEALEATTSAPTVPVERRPRRRARYALAAAAVLLVAAAIWLTVARRGPAGSMNLVAVLPFSVRGGPELGYLGPGMVNLLSTSLDGAGDLRSVDPRAVLTMYRQGAAQTIDPASGSSAARRLGAGRFVLGDIVQGGRSVRITAAMYDPGRLGAPLSEGTVEGAAGDLFTLVDGLAAKLLSATTGPTARVTRIAAVTTSSLPALKAYLDGEAAFRRGQADSALTAFQAAVAADTGFALAYYRLSVAAEWATQAALANAAANQAVQRSAHLADHDRLLLQALQVTRRGASDDAARQYRAILGSYPDDVEAWNQLGEVLFHYSPLHGRPATDSRAAWQRVLYFDPDNEGAMLHLARLAALEHRRLEVDSLVARLVRLSPQGDRNIEMTALRVWADHDREGQARVLGQLKSAANATVALTAWDVSVFDQDFAGTEPVAALLADPARSAVAQAVGHLMLASLDLAGGRLTAMRGEIAQATASDSAYALEYGTYLDLSPAAEGSAAILQRDRALLQRLDPASVAPSNEPTVYFSSHNGLHATIRAYLLGLLSARLGDRAAAERYAVELDAQRGPPPAHALPQDYALEVRAEVARKNGDVAQAAALLDKRVNEVWYEYPFASPFLSGMRPRFLLSELAERQGDARRALDFCAGFDGVSTYDIVYVPWARFRQGRMHERLGDRASAAADYRAALGLWKSADPALKPVVDSARAALARVGGG